MVRGSENLENFKLRAVAAAAGQTFIDVGGRSRQAEAAGVDESLIASWWCATYFFARITAFFTGDAVGCQKTVMLFSLAPLLLESLGPPPSTAGFRPKTSYYALDAAEQSRDQIQPLPYTSATTSVCNPLTEATSTCCTSVYSFSDASSSSLRFRDSRTRTR